MRPVRRRPPDEQLLELRAQLVAVLDPPLVRAIALVLGQPRRAEHLAQSGELAIGSDRYDELAVAGLKQGVWRDARMVVADPPTDDACDRVRRRLVDEHRQ
jgi:hypothetical protein